MGFLEMFQLVKNQWQILESQARSAYLLFDEVK
jgi:hypothetical protein